MNKEFYRCFRCLTPNTRPRVKFKNGICNACINWENKKNIDWNRRKKLLAKYCNKFRKSDGSFDVIVPGGGGKDSSYVAWMLKNKFNMNPLCVCVQPPLDTKIGKQNLDNFISAGFNVIEIKPNRKVSKIIAKNAFIKYGNPQLDWLFAIHAAPIRISIEFNIPFIMWGEEAESEYGGSDDLKNKTGFDLNHIKKYYRSNINIYDLVNRKDIKKSDIYWMTLPNNQLFKKSKIFATHWSFFEKWDEHHHLKIAKKYCGLETLKGNSSGAYNNFSHIDQKMYLLHMYLAYLKFGFARATTDASIDIRAGKMSREKGLKLAKNLDSIFPSENINEYLKYFKMTRKTFNSSIEKFRNKKIFKKSKNKWILDES